tara:strand:+ start:177 stop:644 length:468 start_codon:yes stop_codon:yes gene_type:complete
VVQINLNIEVSAAKGALGLLKRKIPNATAKGIAKAGMFLQNAIKDRTRKGTDFKGRKFRPYSAKYAKQRAKEGRTLTPNLFRSGQMLGNMTFKKLTKTKGQIFFPNRQQNIKAFYNDSQGVGRDKVKREFFSVGTKEEAKAVKIFTDTLMRDLKI